MSVVTTIAALIRSQAAVSTESGSPISAFAKLDGVGSSATKVSASIHEYS